MEADSHAFADDPFVDPSINSTQADTNSGTDLYVSRNARLSLAEDSLVVYGTSNDSSVVAPSLIGYQRQWYHTTWQSKLLRTIVKQYASSCLTLVNRLF